MTPTATPSASPSATPTATPSPSASPSATPTVTPTATPSASPSATPAADPSATPTAAASASPSATATPVPNDPNGAEQTNRDKGTDSASLVSTGDQFSTYTFVGILLVSLAAASLMVFFSLKYKKKHDE